MKKFYSIIAALFVAGAAMAQDVKITVKGTEVTEDAQEFNLVFDNIENEIIPGVFSEYKMDPEIFFTSEKAVNNVVVSIEVTNKAEDMSICFPQNCVMLGAGNDYYYETPKGSLEAGVAKDAEIHYLTTNKPETNPVVVNCDVTVRWGLASKSFLLNMTGYHSGATPDGIANVNVSKAINSAAYNLAGQRLQKESGLVVKSGKKFFVK